jgi:hypothetical protein
MDKEFISYQEKVTECLQSLQNVLSDCEESGFVDPEETTYNQLLNLLNETMAVDTYPELREVIEKGKEIEEQLECWAASIGMNSLETEWPTLPSA